MGLADPVIFDVQGKIFVTIGIQIISYDSASPFCCRYRKRAYASKHVCNYLVRLEHVNETCMLRLQP
jgi:hypothetical protein